MVEFTRKERSKKELKELTEIHSANEDAIESQPQQPNIESPLEKAAKSIKQKKKESTENRVDSTAESYVKVDSYSKASHKQYKPQKDQAYDQVRERHNEVYGVQNSSGPSENLAQEEKAKILDWYLGLPKKGDPERKRKKDLL